eukprot:295397-Hanusia_phi.AAC.1
MRGMAGWSGFKASLLLSLTLSTTTTTSPTRRDCGDALGGWRVGRLRESREYVRAGKDFFSDHLGERMGGLLPVERWVKEDVCWCRAMMARSGAAEPSGRGRRGRGWWREWREGERSRRWEGSPGGRGERGLRKEREEKRRSGGEEESRSSGTRQVLWGSTCKFVALSLLGNCHSSARMLCMTCFQCLIAVRQTKKRKRKDEEIGGP